jgi:hypothetical protein
MLKTQFHHVTVIKGQKPFCITICHSFLCFDLLHFPCISFVQCLVSKGSSYTRAHTLLCGLFILQRFSCNQNYFGSHKLKNGKRLPKNSSYLSVSRCSGRNHICQPFYKTAHENGILLNNSLAFSFVISRVFANLPIPIPYIIPRLNCLGLFYD